MALPLGTTSRQIGAILRWMFVGIVVVGMAAWWYPGYRNWGAMLGAELVALCMWFMYRIVSQDRRVSGNPFYIVLLWPVLSLSVHFIFDGMVKDPQGGFAGGMDLSLLLGFVVLAITVLLSQSLMAQMSQKHASVISICGGAMILGGLQAVFIPQARAVSGAMGLVGFSGVAVWLSALWLRSSVDDSAVLEVVRSRSLEKLCAAVGLLSAGALCVGIDKTFLSVAVGVVGLVFLLAGIMYRRYRMLLWGVVMFVAGGGVLAWLGIDGRMVWHGGWAGIGENGLANISAGSWSIFILGAVAGWLAVGAMIAFSLIGLGVLISRSMRSSVHDQNRAIAWACASGLSFAALLAPGGLFVPAVILAVGLSWGTFPAMSARGSRSWSGVIVIVILVLLAVMFGVARNIGLMLWVVDSFAFFDQPDKFLHGVIGLVLAMGLLWQIGTRRLWLGLVAIVLAVLAGGAGEIIQRLASTRKPEMSDWVADIIGCAIAFVPYLLCMGSRLCESKDVELVDIDDDKYFE